MFKKIIAIINKIFNLKYTHFINQDIYIYLFYIDFKNTFGSIDNTCLLDIIKDLRYPKDVIMLVENIYSHSNTKFTSEHFD